MSGKIKTKDAMSGDMELRDNISFDITPDTILAQQALRNADMATRPPFGFLTGWTTGTDVDNGHVHIFLEWHTVTKLSQKEQDLFYTQLRNEFQKACFKIVTEETINGNVYFHVGFASIHYELEKVN